MISAATFFRILPRLNGLFGLIAIFMATVLALNVLRSSDAFWNILSARFDRAPLYQLQQIFLPDQEQDIAVLVVGDSLFQDAIPDSISGGTLRRVVISGMDADDVGNLFAALRDGHSATQTRVCNVIVQASPSFAARTKEQGEGQDIGFISAASPSDLLSPKQAARVFAVINAWINAQTKDDGFRTLPHMRVARAAGQAKFADPNLENWTKATQGLDQTRSVFFIDKRKTNWGLGSDLEVTLRRVLQDTEAGSKKMIWSELTAAASFPALGCDKESFRAARAAASAARGN